MSELQIALLAIGCAVVAVVYGYGWWQQRSYLASGGGILPGPPFLPWEDIVEAGQVVSSPQNHPK